MWQARGIANKGIRGIHIRGSWRGSGREAADPNKNQRVGPDRKKRQVTKM